MNNTEFIITALKEFARVALLAVIPILIDQISRMEFNPRVILIVSSVAVLRALDKALHEKGVIEDDPQMTLGITRF